MTAAGHARKISMVDRSKKYPHEDFSASRTLRIVDIHRQENILRLPTLKIDRSAHLLEGQERSQPLLWLD